jgi:hypothetical protein
MFRVVIDRLVVSRTPVGSLLVASRLMASILVALLLCSCATAHRRRDFRFVKCLAMDACSTPVKLPSPWTAEHEALYWNAVESLAKRDACGGDAIARGIVFQSERRLTLSCNKTQATIRWLDKNERIENVLSNKDIHRLVVFEKGYGLKTNKGIGVELAVSHYLISDKAPQNPWAEGIDSYEVVEIGDVVEVQFVLEVAF